MDRRSSLLRTFGGSIWTCVLCVGCASSGLKPREPHRVETQADAGSVHIAVTSVYDWDEFSQSLQPAFAMDEKKALASVMPSTQNATEKFLDALQGTLRVSPPRTSVTSTATERSATNESGAQASSSSETTSTREPGSASNAPDVASGQRRAADLPGRDVSSEALGVDPMLQHTSAAALFQEVALLNAAIRRAALRYESIPYVVRLQVTLMPSARDEPYDAYSTISFFSGLAPGGAPVAAAAAEKAQDCSPSQSSPAVLGPPHVIPLLVTDNLETSFHSRTDDVARQLAFALSILSEGFAADLGIQRTLEGLRAVVGRDVTSTLTLGRVSDNTLRVRLGAIPQVDVRHAMVPRTHNVSLVVLVPRALTDQQQPALRLMARTTFVDVDAGQPLRSRSSREIDELLRDLLAQRLHASRDRLTRCDLEYGVELLSHAQANDYAAFRRLTSCLACDSSNSPRACRRGPGTTDCWRLPHPDALWVDLMSLSAGSQYTTASLHLPRLSVPTLPAQSVFLLDDTESEMTAAIEGATGIVPERTRATLSVTVSRPDGQRDLVYSIATRRVQREQDHLKLVFPSLAALKLEPADEKLSLTVTTAANPWLTGAQEMTWSSTLRPLGYVRKPAKPTPPDPGFTLRAASEAIVPTGQKGTVELILDIGEATTKGVTVPTAREVKITVSGAEFALQSVEPPGAAVREAPTLSMKATKDCRMTLSFGNLREGLKLVISAMNTETKVKHPDLSVGVVKPVPVQP